MLGLISKHIVGLFFILYFCVPYFSFLFFIYFCMMYDFVFYIVNKHTIKYNTIQLAYSNSGPDYSAVLLNL